MFLKRLAISIAAIAASHPLFPDLDPALSIACSRLSVVSTPKVTGTELSRDTMAIPLATSEAHNQNGGLRPLSQHQAYYSVIPAFCCKPFRAIGISKAPGTLTRVMLSSSAPCLLSASNAPSTSFELISR
jgi:hypothetical protein